MTRTPTKKYGLLWHTDPGHAVSAGASHSGPSHSGGKDVTYVDLLLRLSPDGPYSMITAPESTEGLDSTLGLLYKRQDQSEKVLFRKVVAGLYQLDDESVTGAAA